MKIPTAVVLLLVLVFTFLPMTSHAQSVRTGQYIGNGTTTQINTGLTSLKVLRIVQVASRGPVSEAYTTNVIQGLGSGTFVNGTKKDQGVAIEVGSFTVTNPDFNETGVVYHWEALGD